MIFLSILFSFRGRMGRAEYAVVLTAALVLLVGGVFVIAASMVSWFPGSPYVVSGAIVLWDVAATWVVFAAHFKRYHDIGGRESLRARLAFAPVIGLFVLLFIPGAAGANRFGPPRRFFARIE